MVQPTTYILPRYPYILPKEPTIQPKKPLHFNSPKKCYIFPWRTTYFQARHPNNLPRNPYILPEELMIQPKEPFLLPAETL